MIRAFDPSEIIVTKRLPTVSLLQSHYLLFYFVIYSVSVAYLLRRTLVVKYYGIIVSYIFLKILKKI